MATHSAARCSAWPTRKGTAWPRAPNMRRRCSRRHASSVTRRRAGWSAGSGASRSEHANHSSLSSLHGNVSRRNRVNFGVDTTNADALRHASDVGRPWHSPASPMKRTRRARWSPRRGLSGVIGALAVLLGARLAHGVCNVIPGDTQTFRAAQTTVNRPFAGPGDFVELGLNPLCHAAEPRFSTDHPEDYVVTVVFTPPNDGPRNAVVLAADCAAAVPTLPRCAARSNVGDGACCRPVGVCGPQPGATTCDVQIKDANHLQFRFPDTDDLLPPADDALTLTGPATLAVTTVHDPLPLALTTRPCARQTGLLACVDDLFASDGTCGTTPHSMFSHFTALPFANDFQALCTGPSVTCTGRGRELRFTVDVDGNVLVPMDWSGILVRLRETGRKDPVPVPRLLRASILSEAFPGSGVTTHV